MANYSEKELKAFRLKDILSSRMSALKAASINNEGKGISAEDMLVESDKYYDWVQQDQEQPDVKVKGNGAVPPTPTADQQKLINAVSTEYSMEYNGLLIRLQDWVEFKTQGKSRYLPSNLASVPEIIKWLNK